MAKRLYNVRAYSDTAANWAINTHVYPSNSLLIATDTGAIKKGDGVNTYAQLGSLGVKQVATVEEITDFPLTMPPSAHNHVVEEITDFPLTMPPSAHDHEVEADEESGLAAAATIQELAEALSARILALETATAEG